MMRLIIGLLFIFVFDLSSRGQSRNNKNLTPKLFIGAEVQWYPAGWLIGPTISCAVGPKHIIFLKTGINLANRHNWSGLNDDERGRGFGGSTGYRYLFKSDKSSLFVGARIELWDTKIKWKNDIGLPQETSGTTKILILQPSLELGYWAKFNKSRWSALIVGGVGQEINIKTVGKEVGQGGMWLLGISAHYSLR